MSSGRTRFARLFLIGTCSTVLAVEALKAAVTEAKAGSDVDRFVAAVTALTPYLPAGDRNEQEDQAWALQREQLNQRETQRLEAELKGYKNNLIKESIRVCTIEHSSHAYPPL